LYFDPPTKGFFRVSGFRRICAKFHQNGLKIATVRARTDRHTRHTDRDDRGDLIICPMLCYNNGTDYKIIKGATVQGVDVTDIQLLSGALRVGGAHLGQNPDTLAFDLVGRLLYYYDDDVDGFDQARRGSDVGTVEIQAAAGSSCRAGLKSLLQQCDAQSTQHSALLPLLPCFDPPTAMSLFILEGHAQVLGKFRCVFLLNSSRPMRILYSVSVLVLRFIVLVLFSTVFW